MAGSTGGRCTPSCGASIPTGCAGPGRSSGGCAHTSGLKPGGRRSQKESRRCSLTGHGCAHSRSDGSGEKSGVTGDCHAPFRGSPGLKCPGRPDYAVCLAAGIRLAGPPPADAIGKVGGPTVLRYLAGELAWGLANAPECYAVLNACRALVYLDEDRIVSKVAGGLAAL